ncbi:hypothetical protein LXL04_020472 [Taraxacum kok-saghyz]
MSVVPSVSNSGSQEFWNSSVVENLFLADTTQTSKAIEMSNQIEEKEGMKNLGESFSRPSSVWGDLKILPRPSEPKAKQKREKKPAMALMSPFKERIVNPRSALTQDHNANCEWIFTLKGNPM